MPKKMTPMLSALASIREEVRASREEAARSTSELREELTQHVKEMEIRLATELIAVAGAVREVRDVLIEQSAVVARVDDHERRITDLERRTG
jgi:hypothetical protein